MKLSNSSPIKFGAFCTFMVISYDILIFLRREFHPRTIKYDFLKWCEIKRRRWQRLNVAIIGNQGLHPGVRDFKPVESEIDYGKLIPCKGED